MPRPAAGRALFYTRDSMGRGECAPPEAVRWAVAWCVAEKIRFGGTPGAITRMMKGDISHEEDLFLDDGVSGNIFRRPGLDALLATAFSDKSVSHVLIPRRDRLARPDNPVDGLMLEIDLRRAGLCLVYQSKVLKPMGPAERLGLEEMLGSLLEFDSSGRFRLELADKLLKAQLQLAARGCSIGGSAPYGFERWLVGPDGTRTRRLLRGEHVRMAGHHTVWLPKEDGHELDVVRRIFELGWTVAPSRIAFQLTREGIPPPNPDGRRTSGVWHASAVRNILNNMIYLAIGVYGKRSEGDQLRFAPDGLRPLTEADFKTSGKLKCVVNPPEQRVVTPLKFAPVVTPEDFARAGASLDSRRRKSRGAPRARGDQWNPLGCRIHDMGCGWPLYRTAKSGGFKYACALYQQSHGQLCRHNAVPGEAASRFALACVRQRALTPRGLAALEAKLREIASREAGEAPEDGERGRLEAELDKTRRQLKVAARNMALMEDESKRTAVEAVYDELKTTESRLESRLRSLPEPVSRDSADEEVAKALEVLGRLTALAGENESGPSVTRLFAELNVNVYLRFEEYSVGKRTLNRVAGGVVTFGASPAPVPLYEGPTSREIIVKTLADGDVSSLMAGEAAPAVGVGTPSADTGSESLGNEQRVTKRCTRRGGRQRNRG
ncbi:recombinase family protein [Zavarzinella formosa]|uniref:recombinase family protein n=1 Tax=Zavarzinella formosa TaxID=360055 RepID=UPI00031FBCEC|nr:recombinase family protein [Zavarzinella formosa]